MKPELKTEAQFCMFVYFHTILLLHLNFRLHISKFWSDLFIDNYVKQHLFFKLNNACKGQHFGSWDWNIIRRRQKFKIRLIHHMLLYCRIEFKDSFIHFIILLLTTIKKIVLKLCFILIIPKHYEGLFQYHLEMSQSVSYLKWKESD